MKESLLDKQQKSANDSAGSDCDCQNHDLHAEHDSEHDAGGRGEIAKLIIGGVLFSIGITLTYLFELHPYIVMGVFIASYLVLGGGILLRAGKNILRGRVFDENFLMSLATIGAFVIGDFPEGASVMLFFQIGEFFQGMAVRKSKKSIKELMDIRPDYANVRKGGEIITIDPEAVNIGDIILVKPGERIPLDGVVIEGESMLDTSALTGESVPRKARVSDTVLSGCINQSGVLEVEVTKTYGESTVAKLIDLVENASAKKAPAEKFITKFARYYTPVVVLLALMITVIPPLLLTGEVWFDWMHRGLVFLVISCPCALVISIPLSFFGGIGGASKRGILVKGGNYLEALNNLDIVVFDKTGTLTKGVFDVTGVYPTSDHTESELLELAASAETFSNHPIALSILRAYGKDVDKSLLSDYKEVAGHGVSVMFGGRRLLAGNYRLMDNNGIRCDESEGIGTKVYVAVDKTYAGCIVISDEVKPDSLSTIAALKSKGIRKTVMLTGDNPSIAEAIARELKIDEVHAGLLPGQKVDIIEMLDGEKRKNGKLAYLGDGINDAPALARADIGIAMGGMGSDAAIEAADVALMTDEPSKIIDAIDAAGFTRRIVRQNIIFALAVKVFFLLLGALGVASMWEAVFADVGVALLAVLNATRVSRWAMKVRRG